MKKQSKYQLLCEVSDEPLHIISVKYLLNRPLQDLISMNEINNLKI